MRVLRRETEPIESGNCSRKSEVQRKPTGGAIPRYLSLQKDLVSNPERETKQAKAQEMATKEKADCEWIRAERGKPV
jgi:hypothetical protein